jgi:hypothetical protein
MLTRPLTDAELARLDSGDPPLTMEEAAARAPYEQLLARIRNLAEIEPPEGWQERAARRLNSAGRGRRGLRLR